MLSASARTSCREMVPDTTTTGLTTRNARSIMRRLWSDWEKVVSLSCRDESAKSLTCCGAEQETHIWNIPTERFGQKRRPDWKQQDRWCRGEGGRVTLWYPCWHGMLDHGLLDIHQVVPRQDNSARQTRTHTRDSGELVTFFHFPIPVSFCIFFGFHANHFLA